MKIQSVRDLAFCVAFNSELEQLEKSVLETLTVLRKKQQFNAIKQLNTIKHYCKR